MSDRPDLTSDFLARFTPSTGGLNRDQVLFQAGRSSARGGRLWPVLSGFLAVTQVATLGWLLFRKEPQIPPAVVAPQPSMILPAPESPLVDDWAAAVRRTAEVPAVAPVVATGSHQPSRPLTVFSYRHVLNDF
jgi:hypothetical protein